MKKIILILVFLISGCTTIMGPANFDNYEYGLINKIYTLSEIYKINCADSNRTKLNFDNLSVISMELVNYSTDIPNNEGTIKLVIPLYKMISSADIKMNTENHSITYCKLKLDNIETTSGIIKHAVAERRRP